MVQIHVRIIDVAVVGGHKFRSTGYLYLFFEMKGIQAPQEFWSMGEVILRDYRKVNIARIDC